MKKKLFIFLLSVSCVISFTTQAGKKSLEEASEIATFIVNTTGPELFYYMVKIGTENWDEKTLEEKKAILKKIAESEQEQKKITKAIQLIVHPDRNEDSEVFKGAFYKVNPTSDTYFSLKGRTPSFLKQCEVILEAEELERLKQEKQEEKKERRPHEENEKEREREPRERSRDEKRRKARMDEEEEEALMREKNRFKMRTEERRANTEHYEQEKKESNESDRAYDRLDDEIKEMCEKEIRNIAQVGDVPKHIIQAFQEKSEELMDTLKSNIRVLDIQEIEEHVRDLWNDACSDFIEKERQNIAAQIKTSFEEKSYETLENTRTFVNQIIRDYNHKMEEKFKNHAEYDDLDTLITGAVAGLNQLSRDLAASWK